jgi:hypothetical protein
MVAIKGASQGVIGGFIHVAPPVGMGQGLSATDLENQDCRCV